MELPSVLVNQISPIAMIVYRIYRTDRETNALILNSNIIPLMEKKKRTPLQRTMRIIIESGLLYTVVSISAFAAVVAESNISYITSAVVCSKHHFP